MANSPDVPAHKPLSGRKAQAARNDGIILDAARAVFLADATAPVAAVAERAGVGISALYRRYPSKEVLLRTLCFQGLSRYNSEGEAALGTDDDARVLDDFLHRVVDADVHSLTVRLAGTFTPDESFAPQVRRSAELNTEILRRARSAGAVRDGVTITDFSLILEACAAVALPDATRTAELRHRMLALLLDGLRTPGELPGPAPRPEDFAARWQPRK
ncbi:TetR family transcriptional regulator [Nocardia sp. NPDC052254]|uniref:TetR/AcrR family transcriptional regulator n=1 Tax=Nocardia sp. NPDC052254 TaxID=3155681 RepID=UPI003427A9FA